MEPAFIRRAVGPLTLGRIVQESVETCEVIHITKNFRADCGTGERAIVWCLAAYGNKLHPRRREPASQSVELPADLPN